MTNITWDSGGPVFKDGKIGAEQGCCCGGGGGGGDPFSCGCPVATITFDLTVTIPEPDPSNDPGGFPYQGMVAGGTYTAQIVIEYDEATQHFTGSCDWLSCEPAVENASHGLIAYVWFPGGISRPVVQFVFEPMGVIKPDNCCGPCTPAGSGYVLGSPNPNAGYTSATPTTPDIAFAGDVNAPCDWPTSSSGTETVTDWDGFSGLDIVFEWEATIT